MNLTLFSSPRIVSTSSTTFSCWISLSITRTMFHIRTVLEYICWGTLKETIQTVKTSPKEGRQYNLYQYQIYKCLNWTFQFTANDCFARQDLPRKGRLVQFPSWKLKFVHRQLEYRVAENLKSGESECSRGNSLSSEIYLSRRSCYAKAKDKQVLTFDRPLFSNNSTILGLNSTSHIILLFHLIFWKNDITFQSPLAGGSSTYSKLQIM